MKKSVVKNLLVLTMVSAILTPAFAASWERVGNGHYVDSTSIEAKSTPGTFTFKTKYIASGAPLEVINGKEIWSIKTESYIDCATNYAKTLSYTAYDSNEKKVASGENVGKQWYDIHRPGTRAYEAFEFVCTDKYINKWDGYDRFWWY